MASAPTQTASVAADTQTALTQTLTKTLDALNLTQAEYDKILRDLGREPNFNELCMFSAMWSEHCCYKHSKHLLKKLPTEGPHIVQGPGENAGIVDVGDDIQVAFKIESHNHPTAVEPYQGAATGVGGILRDIFTMNARPIGLLNALRFGQTQGNTPENIRNRYLLSHAVKGIGDYGNCMGIPTIGGEIFIDDSYTGNPLVNAMAIGVLYGNKVMPSRALGVGNPVLYVGSATGRDGIGGASFASRELTEKSQSDRPAVQVGDPFMEKLLLESCLEAFATGYVVAAQDMGAAGLTCAACEMSGKGNLGMRMDLDKVPAREPGMQPFEYLLSESQERMVLILEKGHEQPVLDIFEKWQVPAVVIGEIIEGDRVHIEHQGQRVVDLPISLIVENTPLYDPGIVPTEPEAFKVRRLQQPEVGLADITASDIPHVLEQLLSAPNIAQANPIFSRYDRHVRNSTQLASENQSAGVLRLRQHDESFSNKAVSASTDCNPRYVALDPYQGALAAVAEAARNVVAVGTKPLAVTNNLNFGNPEKPDVYYQLYYAVEGLKDACLAFNTPVTGGNVSLYNEHSGQAIYPTPVIGMIGLSQNAQKLVDSQLSPAFKQPGHTVALLGRFAPTLAGSEYQALKQQPLCGQPPEVDLAVEQALQKVVLSLIEQGLLQSVQDISLGGLLVTLAECAFLTQSFGLKLDLRPIQEKFFQLSGKATRLDTLLFGETQGSFIISYAPEHEAQIRQALGSYADTLSLLPLGQITQPATLSMTLNTIPKDSSDMAIDLTIDLAPLKTLWSTRFVF